MSLESKLGLLASFSLVAVSVWGAFHSSDSAPPPPRLLDPGEHVLLVGDSIAEGLAAPLEHLLSLYGSPLVTIAHRGDSITALANKAGRDWSAFRVIVLSAGSNDLPQGAREGPALQRLLGILRQQGAMVLWLVPPSFHGEALTPQQAAVDDLFHAAGVPLVPIQGPPVRTDLDPMGIHPDPAGYRQLAAQILDALTTPGRYVPA